MILVYNSTGINSNQCGLPNTTMGTYHFYNFKNSFRLGHPKIYSIIANRLRGMRASTLTLKITFSNWPEREYHHNELIFRRYCLVDVPRLGWRGIETVYHDWGKSTFFQKSFLVQNGYCVYKEQDRLQKSKQHFSYEAFLLFQVILIGFCLKFI